MADNVLKRNMKLFGLPYQFNDMTDQRIPEISPVVGRKYAEHIMMDAPVITIIPGEPSYLPGKKIAAGHTITQNILNSGADQWEPLKTVISEVSKNGFKYYDFKRAYTEYMKYVNILCRSCATFLELSNYTLSENGKDVPLTQYDWRNYRWNAEAGLSRSDLSNMINDMRSDTDTWNLLMESMRTAVEEMNSSVEEDYDTDDEDDDGLYSDKDLNVKNTSGTENEDENEDEEDETIAVIGVTRSVERLSQIDENDDEAINLYITDTLMSSYGVDSENGNRNFQYNTTSSTEENSFTDNLIEIAEGLAPQLNYVQFYIDPDSSDNESMSNDAGDSMLSGIFDNGEQMFKELGFILNSGGIGTASNETMSKLEDFTTGAMQSLSDHISGNTLTGVLGRILSLSSNVVRGDNVIFPKIYQKSDYSKSYTFTVHLKAPYGTRFGYYMDICVPLMHLLALAIPRQSSANTYSSPFLVKAYVEGFFTCNMGLVTNISISRGANDSSLTLDGLPSEVDVTLTLEDLYCDLTMTPQSSPLLFVNNTSLIEYLAVTCGISLISPALQIKKEMIVDTVINSFTDIPKNVIGYIEEELNEFIRDFFTIGTNGW